MTDLSKTDNGAYMSPYVDVHEENELMRLIGVNPDPRLLKKNKFANNSEYLQIGIIESQLDRFFGALNWSFVVTELKLVVNSIVCTGDLIIFYKDRQIRRSGTAAKEIQLSAGSKAMDASSMSSKALERDVPIAKTQALKNAAQSLGNAFGRSLNRDWKYGFSEHKQMTELRGGASIEEIQDVQELERLREFINKATSKEQLESITNLPAELQKEYKTKMKQL